MCVCFTLQNRSLNTSKKQSFGVLIRSVIYFFCVYTYPKTPFDDEGPYIMRMAWTNSIAGRRGPYIKQNTATAKPPTLNPYKP